MICFGNWLGVQPMRSAQTLLYVAFGGGKVTEILACHPRKPRNPEPSMVMKLDLVACVISFGQTSAASSGDKTGKTLAI
jgi:hypothetical protein